MKTNQRTSKPVSEGLARQIGRMVEDASRDYPGGLDKLELAKGHPDFKKRLHEWFNEMAKENEPLLKVVGTSIVPVTPKKFVAKKKFKVDTSDDAVVKISYLGDNFQSCFGDKIEKPISEVSLRYAKLQKDSLDRPIIAELGGEAKAETTLTEIFYLMSQQGHGQDGVLLINGYANIFYVRDAKEVLRAVRVPWYDYGWCVDAHSVENPDRWDGGRQVFSRNSET